MQTNKNGSQVRLPLSSDEGANVAFIECNSKAKLLLSQEGEKQADAGRTSTNMGTKIPKESSCNPWDELVFMLYFQAGGKSSIIRASR
jgi:hypothetical protein